METGRQSSELILCDIFFQKALLILRVIAVVSGVIAVVCILPLPYKT